MPAPPTKAGLQAAVALLTRENAALRELLAAVHETAAAGDAINMDGDVWGAGGRAAQRIAIWLGDDTAHADIVRVERQARLFREHLESITNLGKPAAACGATATDNAGRLRECERPGDGHTAHQHAGDGVRTSMFIWEDAVVDAVTHEAWCKGFHGDSAPCPPDPWDPNLCPDCGESALACQCPSGEDVTDSIAADAEAPAALAASIASGQPVIIADDEPPCGLRLWGDTALCELPAGHDPLPSCKGTPRPFARTTATPGREAAEAATA